MHFPIPLITLKTHALLEGVWARALLHAIDAPVAIGVDPLAAPLPKALGSLSYLSSIPSLVSLGAICIIVIGFGVVIFLGRVLIDYEH